MKYIVAVFPPAQNEEIFLFPFLWNHSDFAAILKMRFPQMQVVSAGQVMNYPYKLDGVEFDQVNLCGESTTLGVKSRAKVDLELFKRSTNSL